MMNPAVFWSGAAIVGLAIVIGMTRSMRSPFLSEESVSYWIKRDQSERIKKGNLL